MKKHLLITAMAMMSVVAGCKKESEVKPETVTEETKVVKTPGKIKLDGYEYIFYELTDMGDGSYQFYAHGAIWIMNDMRDRLDWVEGQVAEGTLVGSVDVGIPSSPEHSQTVVGYVNLWGGPPPASGVTNWHNAVNTWIQNYHNNITPNPVPITNDYLASPPNPQEWLKGVLIRSSNSASTYAVVEGRYPIKPYQ